MSRSAVPYYLDTILPNKLLKHSSEFIKKGCCIASTIKRCRLQALSRPEAVKEVILPAPRTDLDFHLPVFSKVASIH